MVYRIEIPKLLPKITHAFAFCGCLRSGESFNFHDIYRYYDVYEVLLLLLLFVGVDAVDGTRALWGVVMSTEEKVMDYDVISIHRIGTVVCFKFLFSRVGWL
jgi:hypothetical protein